MSHVSSQHNASTTGFAPAGMLLRTRGMQIAALVLVLVTLIITSGGAG